MAASAFCELLEGFSYNVGLSRLDAPSATRLVIPVAIDASTCRLGELPAAGSLRLTALSSLDDFLALDFGYEGSCGEYEPANSSVLELLCHEVELHAGLICLIEQNADLVLVAGEPINRERKDNVCIGVSKELPNLLHTRTIEREAARCIAYGANNCPALSLCVLSAGPLLGL